MISQSYFVLVFLSSLITLSCYPESTEVSQLVQQKPADERLIEYLHEHKVLYHKDWTVDEMKKALTDALYHIQHLSEESACTLLSMLDGDEHEAYDIRKSHLWWSTATYIVPMMMGITAAIVSFRGQDFTIDSESLKNAGIISAPAIFLAFLFNCIQKDQFNHFQNEILPISNELYEELFEALKQKIHPGESALSLIDAFAKTKVLYKRDWDRCSAERALAQDVLRINALSKSQAKALLKQIKKDQDESRELKDDTVFLGFNQYYDRLFEELEGKIGYEPLLSFNKIACCLGPLVIAGIIATLIVVTGKPYHENDPGTVAVTHPSSPKRAAVFSAVATTGLVSAILLLILLPNDF